MGNWPPFPLFFFFFFVVEERKEGKIQGGRGEIGPQFAQRGSGELAEVGHGCESETSGVWCRGTGARPVMLGAPGRSGTAAEQPVEQHGVARLFLALKWREHLPSGLRRMAQWGAGGPVLTSHSNYSGFPSQHP